MYKVEYLQPGKRPKDIMYEMWRKMGVAESTMDKYYAHAVDNYHFRVSIGIMKKYFDLRNMDIIDLGCGWGSLTWILADEFNAHMTAVEHVPEHAEVTAARCQGALVYVGDACDLDLILSASQDIVISHSVIEHIDTHGSRGRCTDFTKKQAHLYEMARIMRPDGWGFLNTGNYNFPFDGEVDKFLFHWLPPETQDKWLSIAGETSDTYTMLQWPELNLMLTQAGFTIVAVENPDSENWRGAIGHLTGSVKEISDIIVDLIAKDPRYMSSWNIILRKE